LLGLENDPRPLLVELGAKSIGLAPCCLLNHRAMVREFGEQGLSLSSAGVGDAFPLTLRLLGRLICRVLSLE